MKVLLLGVGMQGVAALHDLFHSEPVHGVLAADREIDRLETHVTERGYGRKVRCEQLDATDAGALDRLMGSGHDVAIDLLPAPFMADVATSAVRHGVHLVSTNYPTPEFRALHGPALANDVTLLPECGMDPGLDLVMLRDAVRHLDQVTGLRSYGAGIPAPEAVTNPLRYKVSWTLEGVLRAYRRPACLIRDGVLVQIGGDEIFHPANVHEIEIEGLGRLEAYPNGDALQYVEPLALDRSRLATAGRYTLRWPGHCAVWRTLVDLHLLDEEPVIVGGIPVDRYDYLAAALEPHLQYAPDERDLGVLRVEVEGRRAGVRTLVVSQVVDARDLETGLTAVSRLTGFTASIGAQMIAAGGIANRGLLSPIGDLPLPPLAEALESRGIHISVELSGSDDRDPSEGS
jgi:saccharopine dehydrogenase-like NADP-dependent oxidoreductase